MKIKKNLQTDNPGEEEIERALGMIETKGLVASIVAADSMVKSANVKLLQKRPSGGGYVAVMVRGDVGAINTAVNVGEATARRIGQVICTRVIPNPHKEIDDFLPDAT
jgi:ethanolamine utilization protein EutM